LLSEVARDSSSRLLHEQGALGIVRVTDMRAWLSQRQDVANFRVTLRKIENELRALDNDA
jgi:hypothetical protein